MEYHEMLGLLKSVNGSNSLYCERYMKFISSRPNNRIEYTEEHHILPKAKTLFPQYTSLKKHRWNCAVLTPREHFIAHWLLWKALGKFMAYAFFAMRRKSKYQKDRYFVINSRTYAHLREDVAKCQSERIITEETRKRMSVSQKNKKKLECPHCGVSMDNLNAKKYHFDNCKKKTGKDKHDVKQDRRIITCPHCGVSGKAQGMLPNHFDNCKIVRGNYREITETLECPHCQKTGKNCDAFRRVHFDNCSVFTGVPNKQPGYTVRIVACPHCGKEGKERGMLSKHFDNCKTLKPPTPRINCPHCGKEGNDNGYFRSFHIEKCPKKAI